MPELTELPPPPSRRKWALVWAAVLAVAGGALAVRWFTAPPWRVRVHVANLPAGTDFACLAAESDGTLHALDWSPPGILPPPLTMHPAQCGWSLQRPEDPKVDWHAYVRWRPGERYGVVTRTAGVWRVHWFDADAVPLRGRWWPVRGGEAAFDVAVGQAASLSAGQVAAMGLSDVRVGD